MESLKVKQSQKVVIKRLLIKTLNTFVLTWASTMMKVVLVIVLGIIVSDLAGKVVRQESQEYHQYDEDYEPLIIVDVVESGGQVSRIQEGIRETADAGSFISLYVDSVLILISGKAAMSRM